MLNFPPNFLLIFRLLHFFTKRPSDDRIRFSNFVFLVKFQYLFVIFCFLQASSNGFKPRLFLDRCFSWITGILILEYEVRSINLIMKAFNKLPLIFWLCCCISCCRHIILIYLIASCINSNFCCKPSQIKTPNQQDFKGICST